ncbi:hypothetical protein [Novosphingobium resinovorum]|uniref:Uncharacterized protein n=1 Tax=Novosphingobium resinovorum TaxID=158500 RepID=A0A1D8A384_9SPHN|nr:hypothetical protein [Novosphingobium resinovorum]AOR76569.1 hypothetical protein BES08_07265 [Novosphingobium resinovorum]
MRRKVSLLLSQGHSDAGEYPLGFLGDEAALVVERQNALIATEAVTIQAAAASIMSKKGGDHFKKLLKQMTEN